MLYWLYNRCLLLYITIVLNISPLFGGYKLVVLFMFFIRKPLFCIFVFQNEIHATRVKCSAFLSSYKTRVFRVFHQSAPTFLIPDYFINSYRLEHNLSQNH